MVHLPRSGWFVAVLVSASVVALSSAAQAQEAAQPQAAAAPVAMTFETGAGMLFNMIKPDRTADFEWLIAKIKEGLMKSEDATRKQQAESIHVFKSLDATPNSTNVMYVMLINPAVKGADYSVQNLMKMTYEAFPSEQQDIFKRLQGTFGGPQNRLNLQPEAK